MKATDRLFVRVSPKDKKRFNELAKMKGLSLSALIKQMLHTAAKRSGLK